MIKTIILLLFSLSGWGSIEKHFKHAENKTPQTQQIKNIDYIYTINLDKRPERWEKALSQLKPYHITPYRFSAVYGLNLSPQALAEIGMTFRPGMEADRWVIHFPEEESGQLDYDFLREECLGKSYFSRWTSRGAIGCTMSHLSVLQDAYDAGYETIWVLEDDFLIVRDPHQLGALIDKLDALVGKAGWDILYTDGTAQECNQDSPSQLWYLWRPDLSLDLKALGKKQKISEEFAKIGNRTGTYSMVIRRSGMKKILDFEKARGMFIPFDHELAIVPHIQLYGLRFPLITYYDGPSDVQTP